MIISNNFTEYGNGGGLYFNNSSSYLFNVTISENFANYGGGIYARESELMLENINISNNYIIKSVPRACKQILASQATNGEAVKFNI